jgi:hypothetical protein
LGAGMARSRGSDTRLPDGDRQRAAGGAEGPSDCMSPVKMMRVCLSLCRGTCTKLGRRRASNAEQIA